MTPDAVKFPLLTGLFVLYAARFEKVHQYVSENQHRAPVVDGHESLLNPMAHGIFVHSEENGDFYYRVVAVDLDEAVVGKAFFLHTFPGGCGDLAQNSLHPRLAL